jgi:hypothetical protein
LDARIGRPSDPSREDALGEAGAAGVFAAVYLGAFVSKVIGGVAGWGEGPSLLAVVLGRHKFAHESTLVDRSLFYVAAHPGIATTVALTTLAIQGGMFCYLLSPRLRILFGTLVIAFHVNGFVFMGVRYVEPIILALLFSYPWPRIVRRLRGLPPKPREVERLFDDADIPALKWVAKRATTWVAAAFAVTLAVWFTFHWDDRKHLLLEEGFGPQRDSGRTNEPGGQGH